jgi:hypothetical protein
MGGHAMKSLKQQSGLSFPSVIIIAIMVGFFVMCGIRMAPSYLEYMTIRDVVGRIASEPGVEDQSVADIRRRIETLFNTNQIYGLRPSEVEVYREKGRIHIDASYEARIPIVGRIDAVLHFDDLKFIAGQPLD